MPVPSQALSQWQPSERQFRLVIDAIVVYAIYMLDLDGLVATWNTGAKHLKGYEESEILGCSFARFFTPEDQADRMPSILLEAARTSGHCEHEGWRVRKDGSRFWAIDATAAVKDDDGIIVGFAKVTRDMTERFEAQQLLAEAYRQMAEAKELYRHLAETDALTGIHNRRRFDEELPIEWRRAFRERTHLSLLMVDLDQFKAFNDEYGHVAGDDCLRSVASMILEKIRRPGDLAVRFGGEEFAVLLPSTGLAGAETVAEAIRKGAEDMAVLHRTGRTGKVTLSVGVASVFPQHGGAMTPIDLVAHADEALYESKSLGGNMVRSKR